MNPKFQISNLKSPLCALCALCVSFIPSVRAQAAAPEKPNIIFILADDLGLDGVSCYGADKHQTPNIDALAASGTRFTTAYAAPLCGPSRCLLMTGRYAYHTGGITNGSWRAGGPGAKSKDEYPMARMLKDAGYATGQAGKWRQVGELPSDWGFDEFITDNTAGGWYWQTRFNKNGKEITLPEGSYGPDVCRDFALDFLRRHKDHPFFFYYATHLVHKPTLRTPDTSAGATETAKLYDDNIRYMDKEVANIVNEVEKLGLRGKTLIIFSADNGTAVGYPSPLKGRMINGAKGSMLEGGSRVAFVASWPGVTPAGVTRDDLISFADPWATFADLAGAKVPASFKPDGHSFLPQLRGEPGAPRAYAYVQLGAHWFVREPGFKMNEKAELFDMSDAPFVEKPVDPAHDADASKAARARLTAALAELNPAGGKSDKEGPAGGKKANGKKPAGVAGVPNDPAAKPAAAGPWKSGDSLPVDQAPTIGNKPFEVTADIDATGTGAEGVIVSQSAPANGYALYLKDGKLTFSLKEQRQTTTIAAKDPLAPGHFTVKAKLAQDGAITLSLNDAPVATGKAAGLLPRQPRASFLVGKGAAPAAADYNPETPFPGTVSNVTVK